MEPAEYIVHWRLNTESALEAKHRESPCGRGAEGTPRGARPSEEGWDRSDCRCKAQALWSHPAPLRFRYGAITDPFQILYNSLTASLRPITPLYWLRAYTHQNPADTRNNIHSKATPSPSGEPSRLCPWGQGQPRKRVRRATFSPGAPPHLPKQGAGAQPLPGVQGGSPCTPKTLEGGLGGTTASAAISPHLSLGAQGQGRKRHPPIAKSERLCYSAPMKWTPAPPLFLRACRIHLDWGSDSPCGRGVEGTSPRRTTIRGTVRRERMPLRDKSLKPSGSATVHYDSAMPSVTAPCLQTPKFG